MDTLLELLPEIRRLSDREAIRFYNGFRTWKLTYRQLYRRIGGFVDYLDRCGLTKGDRLLLWGENRPEWIVVFWGSLARGVEVVPVDFGSSPRLLSRIQAEVQAKLLVRGRIAPPAQTEIPVVSFDELENVAGNEDFHLAPVSPCDVVQIVYTSGTTGEPKGVVHRHANICANLSPFQEEIDKYKKYARPFQPLRILDMLPLSHLFGQSLGAFFPILLEGAVVFMHELHPGAVIETIRRERVSVLVAVPRLLKNLRLEIERTIELPSSRPSRQGLLGGLERWWRHRKVHGAFGWKFWAIVVGGARLPPEEEEFWWVLGLALIQGYGLTETSPVVATNHPFRAHRGSLGKVVAGQEVRIAADGEILVRGPSVVSDYFGKAPEGGRLDEDGWLHTGDIGYMDDEGRLYYRGRKKDVIVTADGLNVYPQDVESVLNGLSEIKDSAAIGLPRNGEEQVHAVLLLADSAADPEKLVHEANRELETHQRIRSWSVWSGEVFPRTPSTFKIKRGEVRRRILALESGKEGATVPEEGGLEGILAGLAGRKASELQDSIRLAEDLGLSSLDRVDLLSRLEDDYGMELDEESFVELATVGDLRKWLHETSRQLTGLSVGAEKIERLEKLPPPSVEGLPRWTRAWPIRWARAMFLQTLTLPLFRHYIELSVEGLGHLDAVHPPVIFAANHNSDLDTLAVLAGLPYPW
ncbi:MAG: AMP-binding protein, partial [Acidobacteriota bacterium]